ncbi:MAG: Topoisomerase 1-associated factor 1 [Candelina mexicana]|nr:MAG: Topoisomerase 1-associated factor 1 [Candelina mexicana]
MHKPTSDLGKGRRWIMERSDDPIEPIKSWSKLSARQIASPQIQHSTLLTVIASTEHPNMEEDIYHRSVVDPEVRAYVSSLVSALGGTGADEDGRYVLGDDALACLKDLKKWLKLHDEKANRLDVARCLAEANLVNGDLLEILAAWPEEATEDRIKPKISLACLELLVPLTWPIEKDDAQMTVNHHRHTPYLQLAQVSYKRGIINHDTSKILRTAVRIGLPCMAQPLNERSNRDEGIIKLILYFVRNIAMIAVPQNLPSEGDENEVSRSATVEAFHYQGILHLLLTISSSMGEDFNTQDVVVLEILFHLLKGVDTEKLFMDESQLDVRQNDDLRMLMNKEAGMKRGYARNAPTRHNRFGTMIWIKRDDERMSTLSGQDALIDGQKSLAKMDKTKRWNKPKLRGKNNELSPNGFDMPIPLTASANKHLRAFVEEFLDSGFNPLFNHLRKAIEREAERLLEIHSRQFFFLISWFLEAERMRRKAKATSKRANSSEESDLDSFALVASVLNQETFVTLNRFMQSSQDMKEWQDLNAGMRCFTQILLIVQEMSESPLEDDQEIAENILNRIFYEETTHDRVISILRSYKDQGFGYLDACTELSHVFLRMLERYSKQNVDLQVRSKRRARRKKKAEENTETNSFDDDDDEGSETEDVVQAQRASSERRFDFTRFSSKFMTQKCIDTFVQFTRYYNDLDTEQLKRAHRFFYRVAFKLEMTVLLFRVDIIALFNKMMKGCEAIEPANPAYKEWDELVQQLIKRLVRKLEQRPELAIELLFSKINATVHYLEYGYEKQTVSSIPRAPAELEVKPGMERNEQIGVAVSVLIDQNKSDALAWIKGVLASALSERQGWEGEAAAVSARLAESSVDQSVENATLDQHEGGPSNSRAPSIIIRPDTEARRLEMFKDSKLRLLMTLVGFERLGLDDTDPNASWIIPSSVAAKDLEESLKLIKQFEFNPLIYDDGKSAEDFLRRKPAVRPRAEFDDDSDGDNGEEVFLFPANVRSANRKSDALEELKTKRRRRLKDPEDTSEELDDAEREARWEARRKADLMKRLKIKSDLMVHESDEETDEERDMEFFAKEEERRMRQSKRVSEALRSDKVESDDDAMMGSTTKTGGSKRKSGAGLEKARPDKKRKSALLSDSEEDEAPSIRSRSASTVQSEFPLEDAEDEIADTTPLSTPHMQSSQDKVSGSRSSSISAPASSATAEKVDSAVAMLDLEDNDEVEEDVPPVAKRRSRLRAGFVIDSDSD